LKPGRAWIVAAMVVAAGVAVAARSEVRIQPVPTGDGRVLVSFTARDAWTLAMREVLQSGLTVTFDYEVELRKPAPFYFFDPLLARATVSSTAKFDTLTGSYRVGRMRSGMTVRSERLERETDVRDWMTTYDQVALEPITPLEPNADYYVHVRLTKRPKPNISIWSLLPFSREEDTGRADFTYIR
jgi:hypothetical protein